MVRRAAAPQRAAGNQAKQKDSCAAVKDSLQGPLLQQLGGHLRRVDQDEDEIDIFQGGVPAARLGGPGRHLDR